MNTMENSYTTILKSTDCTITNTPKKYDEFQVSNCKIGWILEVDARSWGIKSITCQAILVYVSIRKTIYVEEGEDIVTEEEFVLNKGDWTLGLEYSVLTFPHQIFPLDIELDWLDKKALITF